MKTPMTDRLVIRLDRETMAALAAASAELGLGMASMVRMWLKDRIRQAASERARR